MSLILKYILIIIHKKEKSKKVNKKDKIGRIKIIIIYCHNNAFYGLFKDFKCIQKIKLNKNDINNMSLMFLECSALEEID